MITRAKSAEELIFPENSDIELQKLRALLAAYGTDYDFCRFYYSDGFIISENSGEFVVGEISKNCDFDELSAFFSFGGFSKIFCSERAAAFLGKSLGIAPQKLILMRFCGTFPENGVSVYEPTLSQAYEILKTAFDINFDSWYVEMSHRIRHGVSELYSSGGSVLAVQHNIDGKALLSQVATKPESRGRGSAARLIRAVCEKLSPSEVFIICEEALLGFYEKVGFKRISDEFQFNNSNM